MFSNLDLVVSIRVAKIKYIRSAYFPPALKNNGLIIKQSFPLDDRQKKTSSCPNNEDLVSVNPTGLLFYFLAQFGVGLYCAAI